MLNKLQKMDVQSISQTPIEILLDVDDNGMTTAKKLYNFLELDPKNYSRWCSSNILKNKFAEVNKDYEVFFSEDENPMGGRPTPDYKLTSEFAKQLSMLSKSERGEQARQYFLACEKGLKIALNLMSSRQADSEIFANTLSKLTDSMSTMQSEMYSLIQTQQSNIQQQLTALTALITSTIPQPYKPPFTRWMDKAFKKVDIIANTTGVERRQMLHKLYTELQDSYDIDLSEHTEEYCYRHGIQSNGKYTLNAIGADPELKKLFDLMLDTYIEQCCVEAVAV